MKKNILTITLLLSALTALISSGCSYVHPIMTDSAKIGAKTRINKNLTSLPVPKDPIVAAVYKFRDQTGQYKQMEGGSSFSTAVTQGATSILLRALEDSKWFVVIEREGLANLLNERKIIRSSRLEYEGQQKQGENQPVIPPLLFAGVLLEGGIISYDTNILTGGAGAQYFGIGGSGEFREDRVSVYLRAISTQTGRILKTVYTTKTLLSQKVDLNLYRFVNVKRLLEAEIGYSYNEPTEIAVTEAIEKAVQGLVIEGMLDGLWAAKDSNAINSKVIRDYIEEKKESGSVDDFYHKVTPEKPLSININGGALLYSGDYPMGQYRPSMGLGLNYSLSPQFGLSLNFSRGDLATKKYYKNVTNNIDLQALCRLNPESQITPYLLLGAGITHRTVTPDLFNSKDRFIPSLVLGCGIEYTLNDYIGLNASLKNNYMLNDNLDGISQGKYNDYFWRADFGLVYYLSW